MADWNDIGTVLIIFTVIAFIQAELFRRFIKLTALDPETEQYVEREIREFMGEVEIRMRRSEITRLPPRSMLPQICSEVTCRNVATYKLKVPKKVQDNGTHHTRTLCGRCLKDFCDYFQVQKPS